MSKKTGKPWSGEFCTNKPSCDYVNWDAPGGAESAKKIFGAKEIKLDTKQTAPTIPIAIGVTFERIANALERIADSMADELAGAVKKGNKKEDENVPF